MQKDPKTDLPTSVEQQSKQALQGSVAQLPPETQSRLAQARAAAVKEASKQQASKLPNWSWGTGLAAGAVCAIAILMYQQQGIAPGEQLVETASSDEQYDFLLLSDVNDEDMAVAEDLEFAYWLAQQDALSPETSKGDQDADRG